MKGIYKNELELKEHILKSFSKRVKAIRLQKKLRLTEIANRCNINKSSYHTIENGKRNITIMTLYKIADALEEPIKSFFDEDKM